MFEVITPDEDAAEFIRDALQSKCMIHSAVLETIIQDPLSRPVDGGVFPESEVFQLLALSQNRETHTLIAVVRTTVPTPGVDQRFAYGVGVYPPTFLDQEPFFDLTHTLRLEATQEEKRDALEALIVQRFGENLGY